MPDALFALANVHYIPLCEQADVADAAHVAFVSNVSFVAGKTQKPWYERISLALTDFSMLYLQTVRTLFVQLIPAWMPRLNDAPIEI